MSIDRAQIASHHVSSSSTFELFPTKAYINGKWSESTGGKTFEVYDPASNKMLGSVPDCSTVDLDLAVKAANEAFNTWKNYTAEVNT